MSSDGTLYYFGYGSNLFVPRIVDRVSSASVHATAAVPGYQLRFDKAGNDGSSKANMFYTGADSDSIQGAIYSMDAGQKPALDKIEGVEAGGYTAHKIEVKTDKDEELSVFAYFANPAAIVVDWKPYTWYRDLCFHGARSHGFPEDYCAAIAAVDAKVDEDTARDQLNRYGLL